MLRKTLNSEIMKNSSGRVRVAKKKFGSGRVAGTRQGLISRQFLGPSFLVSNDSRHFISSSIGSRFPCCVLLALSWNTYENPSADKLSRAIN